MIRFPYGISDFRKIITGRPFRPLPIELNHYQQNSDDFDLVRGTGNVFRDFGRFNASVEQARAILAAEIIRTLKKSGLSTRKAEKLTSVAHSGFSRIRNARFERFTLDRMITILGKLDDDAEVNVTFRSRHRDLQEGLHA
jgi:predicted XRE-type DNA-binding protein